MEQDITGLWKMTGKQNMFPDLVWRADLMLLKGGKLTWTETHGANVGASRKGNWTLKDKKFYFQYKAPKVGMVTWNGKMQDAAGRRMSGKYSAGANNAYGGSWSATSF
jgi:hypothetical protein